MTFTYRLYLVFLVILWVLFIVLTIYWTHLDDVIALVATANVFLQGLNPYNFGGIYLPLAYGFVLFVEFIFYPVFGNKIFYFFTFPNDLLPNLMNQITLASTIPLYSIIVVKISTIILWALLSTLYIADFLLLLKIYNINAQVDSRLIKLLILYYLFNPILFSSAVILVKPDELLASIAFALLIYILIRSYVTSSSATYCIWVIMAAILSAVPLLSRLKTPFLPLVVFAFLISAKKCKSKFTIMLYLLSIISFILPMAPLLMEWLYIMHVSGLIQALHPGFYTIYSIFRISPIDINQIALILGRIFQGFNLYFLLIDLIYSVIVIFLILKSHGLSLIHI